MKNAFLTRKKSSTILYFICNIKNPNNKITSQTPPLQKKPKPPPPQKTNEQKTPKQNKIKKKPRNKQIKKPFRNQNQNLNNYYKTKETKRNKKIPDR